ncbi:MAG: Ig-like domain-containing protein, partial [Bacteroidaceae bacterium]|nr:Ig-like domain-containing protein [Bacteroidaceae bacterium]
MNKKIFLAALLLLAAGLQTAWAQSVVVSLKTGRTAIYDLADVDSIIFSEPDEITEHKFVDLGLPSGTLWAACNVGAKKPEECGDYFAWGETTPKDDYTWGNYAYCNGSDISMTKYCLRGEYGNNGFIDYLTELTPEDDAATANWGSEWEMPSLEQCQELLDTRYTATIWETVNGVEGRRIRSYVNGNSIFLPAAGFFYNGRIDKLGTQCLYWTRGLSLGDSNQAYDLWFTNITERMSSGFRYDGQSVRPVRKLRERVLVNEISLNKSTLKLLLGESAKLTATLLPSDATNSIVWWESSDESIATVDIYGNVTANAVGTCNITCHTTDDTDLYDYCDVYVTCPEYVDLGLPSGTLWAT